MKKLITVLFTALCALTYGQNDSSSTLSVEADFDLSSNAIRSDFIRSFYNGEFLDNELKTNTSALLEEENNRIGLDFRVDASYFSRDTLFDTWKAHYGITNRQFAAGGFSDDVFNFVFFGNGQAVDYNAYFNNLNVSFLSYQGFHFGMYRTDSSQLISFRAGLLKGSQIFDLYTENGLIRTATDGSSIDLTLDGEISMSDTNRTSLASWNGTGATFDLRYEKMLKKNAKLGFSINDLGFINFNKNSVNYRLDTSYNFTGILIDNVLSPNDSSLNLDSEIDSLLPEATSQSVLALTPAIIKIFYSKPIGKKSEIKLNFKQIIHIAYKPRVVGNYSYKIGQQFSPSFHIGYGGFTNEFYGLGINWDNKKFALSLQARAINGFIDEGGLSHTVFGQFKWNL